MRGYLSQVTLILALTFIITHAKKPPGFVAPPKEYDPNPPKYHYGYKIQDEIATQGKDEERDGIYAQGRYYVDKGKEASQSVKYFADDWGYHPVVEYESNGPHSKTRTKFVLGVEAIKLENNQKSIPQDPNDPGKAKNLAKIDPSQITPSGSQVLSAQPKLSVDPKKNYASSPQYNPSYTLTSLEQNPAVSSDPQAVLLSKPTDVISDVRNVVILSTPSPDTTKQHESDPNDLNNQSTSTNFVSSTIPPAPSTISTDQSEGYANQIQHAVYFIQQQHNPPKIPIFPQDITSIDSPIPNNIYQTNQPIFINSNPHNTQQYFEQFPQGQALILEENQQHIAQKISHNSLDDITAENLETAALIKTPDEIVSVRQNDFGAQINIPSSTPSSINKLIESTKHLVSGIDVLNINEAFNQANEANDEIENSTLEALLQKYVTPSLTSTVTNIEDNHLQIVASTTSTPPVIATHASLLKQPIIAAESRDSDKPVIEKTEENHEEYSSSSRSSLATTTTKVPVEDKAEVVVTPRPVSSKFLAPITAGIQLQNIEDQFVKDTESGENEEVLRNEQVYVQIQKTVPYYLGMYQYPTTQTLQINNETTVEENVSIEEKASENIELGKTLLYFPGGEAVAQPLIRLLSQEIAPKQITDLNTNFVIKSDSTVDQETLQEEQQIIADQQQNNEQLFVSTSSEKLQNQDTIQSENIQSEVTAEKYITKYVDRPYPVQVPVPYPQPYEVEKVVEKVIREPYPVEVRVPVHVQVPIPVEKVVEQKIPVPIYVERPVEKIVEKPVEKIIERKIPIPLYIEKPVERIVEKTVPQYIDRPYPIQVPQAYLLQIPGVYSQQKYSTLVRNSLQPPQHSPQKLNEINRQQPQKLKKLNLLVFPGKRPDHTQNILSDSELSQSFRYSNAQLNNGYLPPSLPNQKNCNDPQGSASQLSTQAVRKPEQFIGLIPPRPNPVNLSKYRTARSNFDEKSIRLEYGFMPPLIPSLEIDEMGQPVHKEDSKL